MGWCWMKRCYRAVICCLLPQAINVRQLRQCPRNAEKKLLDLARKHDFLIIEDDYEFEMNFLAAASPALKSLDTQGRVLYVGSFSKSLFPGLRLGYLAASQQFIVRARQLRHLMFRHPPGHAQRTAAYFMALGYHNEQILRLKRVLARRREIMQKSLDECGLSNSSAARFGGTSFWIGGPDWLDAGILAQKLKEKKRIDRAGWPVLCKQKWKIKIFSYCIFLYSKENYPRRHFTDQTGN